MILNKLIKIKDRILYDLYTKISIYFSEPEVYRKKGRFNQRAIFYGKGKIYIDDNFMFGFKYGGGFKGRYIELQVRDKNAIIKIGKNIATNNGLFICAKEYIEIKDDVLIGNNVTIMDHNGHGVLPSTRRTASGTPQKIIIGNNVWIGNNVTILPGTIIGDNSIVGVGTVIKGEYPKDCIISGNPSKIIKNFNR